MDKFEELAKRVEAGEINRIVDFGLGEDTHHQVRCALKGSLDAAKALHEAVLPGYEVLIHIDKDNDCSVAVGRPMPNNPDWIATHTPAAAWVAAILRAKGSTNEQI